MVPNFNKMTRDELMQFWKTYTRPTRKGAEELVGDRRPGFTNIASSLANYACNMAVAMDCRKRKDRAGAASYEKIAFQIYQRLPADIRW